MVVEMEARGQYGVKGLYINVMDRVADVLLP